MRQSKTPSRLHRQNRSMNGPSFPLPSAQFYQQPTQQNTNPFYPPAQPIPGQFQQPPTQQPLAHQRLWSWYKRQRTLTKVGVGCLTLVLVLFFCNAAMTGFAQGITESAQTNATPTPAPATRTPTKQTLAISQPTVKPAPKPTPRPKPKPTPTPLPPLPTQVPTATPVPTQAPLQTTGVDDNPWGYDFNPGNPIYSPPANFCLYFTCIQSFWKSTNGYVEECSDGDFSHSGGVSGSCSYHDGNWRELYSH